MNAKALSTETAAPQPARPTLSVVSRPEPTRAAEQPMRDWMPLGDGRQACSIDGSTAHVAILSPLPEHQAMRLLEVDGKFHILTGRVADDHAMKVVAEDVIAGF